MKGLRSKRNSVISSIRHVLIGLDSKLKVPRKLELTINPLKDLKEGETYNLTFEPSNLIKIRPIQLKTKT